MSQQQNIKTVIVTGAAGYIGGAICIELKKQGYRVVGVDKRVSSHLESYYDEFIQCDFIDTKSLNNVVQPNGQINISKVIDFIYKSITNQFNIIPYDNRNVQIVSSFLLNINNVGLYYSLLFPS